MDDDFIERETTQLNNLQKNFTPNQVKQYSEEVQYIKYLLSLLKKEKAKPQTKKAKKDEDDTKDKISKSLIKLINHFSIKKATDVNTDKLTPDEILDAKLTKISTKNYKLKGMDSDNYLAQEGIDPDWSLDESLSSDKHVVATNSKTGEAVVAFRGTDKKNLGDIEADARIIMGSEGNHEHFTSARQVMRDAIAKYGKENVRTAGYSLGGNKSWLMGQEFGVDSRSYNPFMGKTTIKRPDFNTGNKHTILRTQDDLPSAQAQQLDGKSGTEVKVLATRGGKNAGLNPFKAHADTNFTTNEGRSSSREQGALAEKLSNLQNHSAKHGELATLNDMIKANSERSGLFPPPEKSSFQTNMDSIARAMPDPHLPKQTVPKNLLPPDGVSTHNKATGEYNQETNPLFEFEPTKTNPLVPEVRTRVKTSANPLFDPPDEFVRQETSRLEARLGLDRPVSTPDPNSRSIAARTKVKLAGQRSKKLAELRSKIEPPLERPTNSSRGLSKMTRVLEDQMRQTFESDVLGNATTPVSGSQQSKQSFTDWAANNGVKSTNSKKLLWEKSGGILNDSERVGYDPSEAATFNSESDVNNFINDDQAGRNTTLDEHSTINQNMQNELNSIDNAGFRAGGKSYVGEIARGLHPINLGVGLLAGAGAEAFMKQYIDPNVKQSDTLRTLETGGLAGYGTSLLLGTAALPEIVAGAAGFATQKYTSEGIYKGLRSLGVGQEASVASADIGGGAAAGGVAGLLGSAVAGATTGAEEGAIAGGGIFSAEAGLIGAGIGGLIGAGAYAYGRLFGKDKT